MGDSYILQIFRPFQSKSSPEKATMSSKSDVLVHETPAGDQRSHDTPQTTAEAKNSLSPEVQAQLESGSAALPTTTTTDPNASRGKVLDDQLDAEDQAEIAKKDAAKAQSAAAHGKDHE